MLLHPVLPIVACLLQDAPAEEQDVRPLTEVLAYQALHHDADAALVAGRLDAARAGFEACLVLEPEQPTVAYALACVAARAGEVERALEHLDQAVTWGYVDDGVPRWDSDLDSLRDAPGFDALLERMVARRHGILPDRLGHERLYWADKYAGHAAISPSGEVVVLADSWGYLHVCEARTGALRRVIAAFDRPIGAVDVSPDGAHVAALAYDGTVASWRLADGRELFREPCVKGRKDEGWGFGSVVQYDPTGQRLFVAARDQGGAIFGAMGEVVHSWQRALGGFFGVHFAWRADGAQLALVDGDQVHLHSADDGALVRRIETGVQVTGVAFDPSDGDLATGHDDAKARVWDMPSGDLRFEYAVEDVFLGSGFVPTVAFSPDGANLAVTSASSCNVWILNAETGERFWHSGFLGGRMGEPVDVSWSDERTLWYMWRSGAIVGARVDVPSGEKVERPDLDLIPDLAEAGLYASPSRGSVLTGVTSGPLLWCRTATPEGRSILYSPTGYLSGRFPLDPALNVVRIEARKSQPLSSVLIQRYDPKRVRAAIAGVPLVPVAIPPRPEGEEDF